MNSDKASAVRDSVNGCPTVISDDSVVTRDREPFESKHGTLTGDRVDAHEYTYKPAHVQEVGSVAVDDGEPRPTYVVVLEPVWTELNKNQDRVLSLPPELVYEVARHDCWMRFYPREHEFGASIWIVDHWTHDFGENDGDRCRECGGTYFKIREGEPECARCGRPRTRPKAEVP